MINITDRPILNPAISATDLDFHIRNAIRFAIRDESKRLRGKDDRSRTPLFRHPRTHARTFAGVFAGELDAGRVFDAKFLEKVFDFAQIEKLKTMRAPILEARGLLAQDTLDEESGANLLGTRTAFRTILFYLWSQNVLTLPMAFSPDTSITPFARRALLTEVAAFYWFAPTRRIQPKFNPCLERESKDVTSRQNRMVRFLLTTNWHSFEDVNLQELSVRFVGLIESGDDAYQRTAHVFTGALCALNAYHQDRLSYSCGEVELFRRWTHSSEFKRYTLDDYHLNLPKIQTERKQLYATRGTEKVRKEALVRKYGKAEADQMEISIPTVDSRLLAIANSREPEAPEEYFVKLLSRKRGYSKDLYVGREHIDVPTLGKHWFETLDGYLVYKQARGAESREAAHGAFSLLCDYLFCYLPWWQELNPAAPFVFPKTPADFKRSIFVLGSGADACRPLTFIEAMRLRRRTAGSEGQVITILSAFFRYLDGYKSVYPVLANREIERVFYPDLDYPRRRGPKSKTNKIPFTKKVMPYLLRYLYSLEEFSIHLQNLSLRGGKHIPLHRQPSKIIPADFDFDASITVRGESFPIKEFPNILPISKQTIRLSDGSVVTCQMPVLGGLRMIIAALETGLRLQSIQWLDLYSWNSLNNNWAKEVHKLLVNTDKAKDGPWVTSIGDRTFQLLAREQAFQLSLAKPNTSLIEYEKREGSRFAPINPLFRSARPEGMPVDDSAYQSIWLKSQIGFERFYNEQVSPNEWVPFVEIRPRYLGGHAEKGNEIVEKSGDIEYSPLRLRCIHTPHTARASFITHRISIMDIDDIQKLVGHNNSVVTSHYVVESEEDITEKLMLAESQVWDYDPTNAVCIRADAENSALRRSLQKDREATTKNFGFLSLGLLNEEQDDFLDGVALFKTTPATQIVLRETHICPVGEMCPPEVLKIIHEPRRCGLCPLAIKCVDHSTGITGKIHQLKEQILASEPIRAKRLAQRETAAVEEMDERRRLDVLELTGWLAVDSMLAEALEQLKVDGRNNETLFHVDMPDAVRLHLKHVTRNSTQAEFLVQRLVDSKNYPALESPILRSKANVFRRQLLTNSGRLEEVLSNVPEGDEVEAALSAFLVVTSTLGLTASDILKSGRLDGMINGFGPPNGQRAISGGTNLIDVKDATELVN